MEYGKVISILLLGLWAAWTEYRMRSAQSKLLETQEKLQDALIKINVEQLSDSDLKSKLDANLGRHST